MADPNYNWLIPQDFRFKGDPFIQYSQYWGPGGLMPDYDPSQGKIYAGGDGTNEQWVMPELRNAYMASDELVASDPRWRDRTQMEVVGSGDGWYDVKLKSDDKEGSIVRLQQDPQTGEWVSGGVVGTDRWDTNEAQKQTLIGIGSVLAAPLAVGAGQAAGLLPQMTAGGMNAAGQLIWNAAPGALAGAGATGAGAAGAGATGTAGTTSSISLPTLEQVYTGGKAVLGGIGTANTISNLTTGAPLIGNNGHLYNTAPSNTNTGSNNVTTTPGSNTGTTPGSGNFDLNTLFNFLLGAGGQAISAGRQENMADQLLSMYNDATAKAKPWEDKLAASYTPEGQQALLQSPEFMGQLDAYKTGLDRKASRYGTLTNPETGIQGAERGRTWALQQKAYGLLGDYRKPIQDQVELYTKNAADYKMLAAFGLASEANIPGQWAQTLAKQFGTGDGQIDWNKVFRSADTVVQAGGSILDWWNNVTAGADTEPVNTSPTPGFQAPIGSDPANDNVGYDDVYIPGEGPPDLPSIDDILGSGDVGWEGPW